MSSYIARPASVMREGKAVFDSMRDCLCGYDNAILHILDFRIRQLTFILFRNPGRFAKKLPEVLEIKRSFVMYWFG